MIGRTGMHSASGAYWNSEKDGASVFFYYLSSPLSLNYEGRKTFDSRIILGKSNTDSEVVQMWNFKYEQAESKGFDVVLSVLWISIV